MTDFHNIQIFEAFVHYCSQLMSNAKTIDQLTKLILQKHLSSASRTFIAISGAAALGKTTLANTLRDNIMSKMEISVDILPTDAFIMTRKERYLKGASGYDPRATKINNIYEAIRGLLRGECVSFYPYDHGTGSSVRQLISLKPSDIILVDGIHSFHSKIRRLMDLKIFLNAKHQLAIEMRSVVDVDQRGYAKHFAISTAHLEHKNYEIYIHPYIEFADVILQVSENWIYEIVY
jgi:uridine kinase